MTLTLHFLLPINMLVYSSLYKEFSRVREDQGRDEGDSDAKTALTHKLFQYRAGHSRRVNAVLEKIIY